MEDVVQIRVGRHITGIIGLKKALAEAAVQCREMPRERIGKVLLEKLSGSNYIPQSVASDYEKAFLIAYLKHVGLPADEAPPEGLQIKVLGPGCPQCERLEKDIMDVMAETGITADLEHVRDLAEIGRYGVMGTPALVINGRVRAVGRVPSREKLRTLIQQASEQEDRV